MAQAMWSIKRGLSGGRALFIGYAMVRFGAWHQTIRNICSTNVKRWLGHVIWVSNLILWGVNFDFLAQY